MTSIEFQAMLLAVRTETVVARRHLDAITAQCDAMLAHLMNEAEKTAAKPADVEELEDDCTEGRHPKDLVKHSPLMGRPSRSVCMACGAEVSK